MLQLLRGILNIWFYKRRTAQLRKKAGLAELYDADDLPDPAYDPDYVHVLTEKEEKDLHRGERWRTASLAATYFPLAIRASKVS